MTRHTATAFLAFLFSASAACAADLTIAVDGVANAEGQVMVALYNTADTFLAKPYRAVMTPAKAGTVKLQIKELPAGEYAFAIYHDANNNGKMDVNAVGMPVEDYAFSNNAMGKRGAPSFQDARFELPAGGVTVGVNLR
jgi:uncharacterized protein (DUF2141 family)